MNGHDPYISKSKFLWGARCQKLLWVAYNRKDLICAPDAAQQAIFDQGHEVGELEESLYPDGIEINADATDFDGILQRTLEATRARKPLFEAGFICNNGFGRADILNPVGSDGWDLIEVKSSTDVKNTYLLDLAFQASMYEGAGLKIRRCSLLHVDRSYVRQGPIDAGALFKVVDVTKDISAMSQKIGPQLEEMLGVIRCQQEPDVQIGPHCNDPYSCPLQDKCWAFLPEQNVTTLYRGGKKIWRLFEAGIFRLAEIPDDFRLTINQNIQRQAAISGEPVGTRRVAER